MLFLIKSTYHHLSTYVVDSIPFGLTNIGFKSVFFSRETRKQKYILLIFLFSFRIGLKPQSFKIFYCIDKVWTAGEIVVSSRSCSRPRWQRCLLCNVFAEVFASDQAASRRRTQVQDHCRVALESCCSDGHNAEVLCTHSGASFCMQSVQVQC